MVGYNEKDDCMDNDILEFFMFFTFSTLENGSGNDCILQLEMAMDVFRFLELENDW
jgi:hypothetical protein